jgi:8-oxo-dGTP pyrophosphatase MutT (NUDIX family)
MTSAQAERLRALLLDPRAAQQIEVAGSTTAAVLVPLYERDGELHVVFIKRRSDLRLHAGQVSFPGGRQEPGDTDLTQTALREAHEEIGLDPHAVTIVGALAPTPTVVSDIAVYPVVGLIGVPTAPWILAPEEVDAVIVAPLAALAATHRLETRRRANGTQVTTDAYTAGAETVWGATARIVGDLIARLEQAAR